MRAGARAAAHCGLEKVDPMGWCVHLIDMLRGETGAGSALHGRPAGCASGPERVMSLVVEEKVDIMVAAAAVRASSATMSKWPEGSDVGAERPPARRRSCGSLQ